MNKNYVPNKENLIEVSGLKQYFPIKVGLTKTIP